MSFKSKNLSYEAQEPSFLRKLRSQQSGRDNDRHEYQLARPRRSKGADDDEAPTYVHEESNQTLSKEEYEALVAETEPPVAPRTLPSADVTQAADNRSSVIEPEPAAKVAARSKQEVTEIGNAQKKRKAAKVVGSGEDAPEEALIFKNSKKSKKQSKAVKLSFGIDEG